MRYGLFSVHSQEFRQTTALWRHFSWTVSQHLTVWRESLLSLLLFRTRLDLEISSFSHLRIVLGLRKGMRNLFYFLCKFYCRRVLYNVLQPRYWHHAQLEVLIVVSEDLHFLLFTARDLALSRSIPELEPVAFLVDWYFLVFSSRLQISLVYCSYPLRIRVGCWPFPWITATFFDFHFAVPISKCLS